MAIETLAEHRLGADEAEIAALLARCFTTDFGGRSFFQQRHHLRLIWREEAAIRAHLAILFRAVRLGGALVTVAGLAEVCCDPDWRGRGLAGKLLQASIEESRAAGVPFLLLFGKAKLYGGAGFQKAANPMRYLNLRGAVSHGLRRGKARELMVLQLGPQPWDATAELDLLGHLF